MLVEERDGAIEIVVAVLEVFQCAPPKAPLVIVAAAEGENDRQGDLALAEIVADRLTEIGLPRRIVEHVVDQLEGDAEIEAESGERRFLRPRPIRDDPADLAPRR